MNSLLREKPIQASNRRRLLTGANLDARIRQDIAELYAERGLVLNTDLIRLGYTRAQVKEFQSANT